MTTKVKSSVLDTSLGLTGMPTAPTAASGTANTMIATTAFVSTLLVSPTFTGAPLAPTATTGTANTMIATTAFVGASLGTLGSMASQSSSSVTITGGSISGASLTGTLTGNASGVTGGYVSSLNGATGAITNTTYGSIGSYAIGASGASFVVGNTTTISGLTGTWRIMGVVVTGGSTQSFIGGYQFNAVYSPLCVRIS